jgi:hypothetical protein
MSGAQEHEQRPEITRRSMLRRAAVAGGTLVWATPVIQTISMRHAFAQASPPPSVCRMTGGGFVDHPVYGRVSKGFELHCNAASHPNNLEVNWGKGPAKNDNHKFKLTALTSAACSDDPSIEPDPPRDTELDTYTGSGVGEYDGAPNATAQWTFTDAGEPGRKDHMRITILAPGGGVVLNVDGNLDGGNHQMHC